MSTTITPLGTYRNERPYPFCPGCGHGPILDALDRALVLRGADPADVVIVSDIGCSGLSDQYFATSAFHGLHGRSITYASGIKLARPELDVIVVMGDGGTGIGGAHLLSAARRNIGITVAVFNNLNFGMTGGQHSTTTPTGAVTSTTPGGNLERPLDIAGTVAVNGAQYVWRGSSFSEDLPERIAEAMGSGGFALLDIWELCTAYYVRSNSFTRRALDSTLDELGFETGLVARRSLPEFAAEYRRRSREQAPEPEQPDLITPRYRAGLDRRFELVLAGAAGGRVRTAVRLAARAATDSGLWAAQADDYPITVKTGHSLSSLVLEPGPVAYPGVTSPDVLVVAAAEGRAKAAPLLRRMGEGSWVVTTPDLPVEAGASLVREIDPGRVAQRVPRADLALVLMVAALGAADVLPAESLLDAAGAAGERFAERTRELVELGLALAR